MGIHRLYVTASQRHSNQWAMTADKPTTIAVTTATVTTRSNQRSKAAPFGCLRVAP
ncbi:hypothetical protein HME01_11940 [Vreelandella aquamarina]|nr:hypothetical protein HME01_11940 [Halomonas meridiana]